MRRTQSSGSFIPDKIKLSGKKNERSSDGNVVKDSLSLWISASDCSGHSGEQATKSTGGKDDWENELLNLTPRTQKKKLSLLRNFRRRMQLLNDPENPSSVALSLTSKPSSDEGPQMKEQHEEKDKLEEEEASCFDDPADSEAATKSLGRKMLRGVTKRLTKNRFRSPSTVRRKSSVETNNSEDSVVKATIMEMTDSKSAWMEIAFENLLPDDQAEDSEPSATPKKTERTESTEPTSENSVARRLRRSRSVGTSPHCTTRKTATAVILNVEETNSPTKGTDSSGTRARQGRRNRSTSLSRRSPNRLRDRTRRVASISKSPSRISGSKSPSQVRTRKRVDASPRSLHSRKSLPTISLDGEAKSPPGNTRRSLDGEAKSPVGNTSIPRAGRRSLDGEAKSPAGNSPRAGRKSSTRSNYEASPGRRRRKKSLVGVGGDGIEDENVPRERSSSTGSYSQHRRTPSTGSISSSTGSRRTPSTGSKSRHSTLRKSKSEKPKMVKNLDASTLSGQNNLYGTVPECPSVGSASESVFSDYMEDSTPKTVKAVLVTSQAESADMQLLEDFLDNSHHEVPEEDYLWGRFENINSVSDIPRSSLSSNNGKERPSLTKTLSNQSLSSNNGKERPSLAKTLSNQSLSSNNGKERPSLAKTLSNQSLSKPGSPYIGGRYVSLKEKASRHSSSKDRKKMIDGALNASLSCLSIGDEGSVASLGLDRSINSLFFDAMAD
jgi:hypothetical protein